jgi:hypothetical protein
MALSSTDALHAPHPEHREVAMTKPEATTGKPRGSVRWVESQVNFSGATEKAVQAEFMAWYRANVHGVRNVKPRGVKRVSDNGVKRFLMLVEYEIKSAFET